MHSKFFQGLVAKNAQLSTVSIDTNKIVAKFCERASYGTKIDPTVLSKTIHNMLKSSDIEETTKTRKVINAVLLGGIPPKEHMVKQDAKKALFIEKYFMEGITVYDELFPYESKRNNEDYNKTVKIMAKHIIHHCEDDKVRNIFIPNNENKNFQEIVNETSENLKEHLFSASNEEKNYAHDTLVFAAMDERRFLQKKLGLLDLPDQETFEKLQDLAGEKTSKIENIRKYGLPYAKDFPPSSDDLSRRNYSTLAKNDNQSIEKIAHNISSLVASNNEKFNLTVGDLLFSNFKDLHKNPKLLTKTLSDIYKSNTTDPSEPQKVADSLKVLEGKEIKPEEFSAVLSLKDNYVLTKRAMDLSSEIQNNSLAQSHAKMVGGKVGSFEKTISRNAEQKTGSLSK